MILLVFWVLGQAETDVDSKLSSETQKEETKVEQKKLYVLEGTIDIQGLDIALWGWKTRVLVDGGKFIGYLKHTGEFRIANLPSGSYVVEVASPNHVFEPARVDISGKTGKIRARKLNLLKPNAVSSIPYPLKFQASKQAEFFQVREQWSILGMLKNPMVSPVCMYSVIN